VDRAQALQVFKDCGALLEGHFVLTSGRHSGHYLQCALVCQHPSACAAFCHELGGAFAGEKIDAVIGPAMGGIVVAYELARTLRARGIFMERDAAGCMTLRRGFALKSGERVVVAEDVMTTGGSVAEIVDRAEAAGAEVVGVACLVDRGGLGRFAARRTARVVEIDLPTYPATACPLCAQGAPAVKPGSRKSPGA
jgi:orotate phosphoribosyltransferase